MSKKILVTGGTGYIGSHTAVELIQAGYEVAILDNLSNSKIEVLDKIKKITGVKPKFYKADIRDIEALHNVFRESNFDAVIHFAGLKAVAESIEKPLSYYENNVIGSINLLKCMEESGVKNIVFSSSATVYGELNSGELDEDMTTGVGITNPYGETKHVIEKILQAKVESDKSMSAVILRYFNPVGAHESGLIGEDPNGIPNNLMPIIMRVYRGKMDELSVFGNDYPTRDGTCIRDYIHVVDLAKGHLASLQALCPGKTSIYNLGTGSGSTVLEVVDAFNRASKQKLPYKVTGRRMGDLAEVYADASKSLDELGWQTELVVADAMRDTINFLKMNEKTAENE